MLMARINPVWPREGDTNWDDPLIAGLNMIVAQVNSLDAQIAAGIPTSGNTGGGTTTPTNPTNPTTGSGGVAYTDNGDGTISLAGSNVTDNGDGTLSFN